MSMTKNIFFKYQEQCRSRGQCYTVQLTLSQTIAVSVLRGWAQYLVRLGTHDYTCLCVMNAALIFGVNVMISCQWAKANNNSTTMNKFIVVEFRNRHPARTLIKKNVYFFRSSLTMCTGWTIWEQQKWLLAPKNSIPYDKGAFRTTTLTFKTRQLRLADL